MWKPVDEALARQLAIEVVQIVKAICPQAVVTYAPMRGLPLDIDLALEVYNVSEDDRERIKIALRPFRRDTLKRLHYLVAVFYRSELPPDGAKPVEVIAEAQV